MKTQMTATERMSRLLAVVPWVVERQGAPLDDITTRFDYPREQLIKDLTEVLFFVGVHPFTPDALIEVDISDDIVQISYAEWFSRPLRLTPSEATRLLTAGRSLLMHPFATTDERSEAASPLLRALTKLEMALGSAADQAVEVQLGSAPLDTLETLRTAINKQLQTEIEYYTFSRNELTKRTVEPFRLFSDKGEWYLQAWCHLANDERIFRVDRTITAQLSNEPAREPTSTRNRTLEPQKDNPRVLLRLHPSCAWVTENYPTVSSRTDTDGKLVVEMLVWSQDWLERLLLRLGDQAAIINIDAPYSASLVSNAAQKVLERYR